jgi:hypothetical protein
MWEGEGGVIRGKRNNGGEREQILFIRSIK